MATSTGKAKTIKDESGKTIKVKEGSRLDVKLSSSSNSKSKSSSSTSIVPRYDNMTGKLLTGGYNTSPTGLITAIPAGDIGMVGKANLPQTLLPNDPGNLVAGNNAGLSSNEFMSSFGFSGDGMGGFSYQQPALEGDTAEASQSRSAQNLMQKLGLMSENAPVNTADIYAKELKASGVKKAQQEVNNYASQLNSIVAKAQADQLSLEGQGRGIPEVIIGGQQAQINREAAIAALPVQAQLAAAQGNLEMAQQHLDTMFKLKSADAQAQYDYRNKIIDSLSEFATKSEERRLNDLKAKEERAYGEGQDFLKTQSALLTSAVSQRAPQGVVSAINRAKTPQEAIIAAGEYAGDILDRQYKQAQIANVYSTMQSRGEESAGYDPSEILAFAQQYASTGTLPPGIPKGSFGILSQVAKELPKPEGTLVDRNTGVKPAKLSAVQEEGIIALRDAEVKLSQLKELYNNPRISLPFSTEREQFKTIKNEFVDLLTRARSGAAITENEERVYGSKIPSINISLRKLGNTKLDTLNSTMQGKLDTTLSTKGLSIYGHSKVRIGDEEYTVGDIISNGEESARVNPDGTLTLIQ